MVLELARPSEARCFPPGRWFFRSCFTAAAAGTTEAVEVEKGCFSRISEETLGSFWRGFGTSSSFRGTVFSPPAGDFFEAVLLQQPQATEAVDKGCFSRISDGFGTSSSFRGTVFSPRQVIFSKLFCCSRRQQKLSKKVVFLGFQKRR